MLQHRTPLHTLLFIFLSCITLYGVLYATFPYYRVSLLPDYLKPFRPPTPSFVWNQRSEKVKTAFLHAYHGYERYAAPSDELKPLSNKSLDNFNGWGVTAVDSLDTMLLMGLDDEYKRALEIVKGIDFSKSRQGHVPYFETIIRYLGGLLSAYALSNDSVLLERAEEMVLRLDPVFNSTSGLPYFSVDPASGNPRGPKLGILAEIATLQLEYSYLAKLTGKIQHFNRSASVMKAISLVDLRGTGGMLPVQWDLETGLPNNSHLSVGAQADSAHEYLLKLYLLTGRLDTTSLEMYIRATTRIISDLLYLSPLRHLLYVTDIRDPTNQNLGSPTHIMEHLSCFLPGLLALGAHTLPLDNLETLGITLHEMGNTTSYGLAGNGYEQLSGYNLKEIHLWAAEGLAETCWLTYADQVSGLGPDEILIQASTPKKSGPDEKWLQQEHSHLWMDAVHRWKRSGGRGIVPGLAEKGPVIYTEEQRRTGKGTGRDYYLRRTGYLLRPETVESLYMLWKTTGDSKWRERGWVIFEAIEREAKTGVGYASLLIVDRSPAPQTDSMPSYFMAETLKYLYLMCLEDDPLPLEKWVFNTEAHPFPVFSWTEDERRRFGITT